ncbi:MAG TPA: hypothetical protein VJ505_08010 [Holophagaceae bacterium]|nr:hypothetical protein [Holophagaceae bacterium]
MKRFLPATLVIAFLACTEGPIYQAPPRVSGSYARLIIFREPGFGGAAWPHNYYVDKHLVASLRVNNYTFLAVKEGTHEVHYGGTAEFRGQLLKIDMKAGETYYFKEGRTPGTGKPEFAGQGVSSTGKMSSTTGQGAIVTVTWTDSVQFMGKEQAEAELKAYQYKEAILSQVD